MIVNPFDHGDNSFAALFPPGALPDGITGFKYEGDANPPRFVPNSCSSGAWTNPAMLLNPGKE